MPLTDRLSTFGLGVSAVVNSGATAKLGSEIDLQTVTRDIGNGWPFYALIQIKSVLVGSGASFELRLVSDSTTNLASSPTRHWTSGTIAVSSTTDNVVGRRWFVEFPMDNYERYLGLTITGSGANITAGTIDAFVTPHKFRWAPFVEAVS